MTAGLVLTLLARPVLASANPGKRAGRFAILAFALIVVLAVAAHLQPLLWLLLAGLSGATVLAHQRGMLPHRNDFKISRRRQVGRRSKSTGRRSHKAPHRRASQSRCHCS
ncbi:hypothetical protein [Paenarthrobacter sp. TA1.8]|uniref:hypothetical protein n=1 Tax=Paenarthrobacter sp. TA1.8 TaxID=3400219 RepID=UPI003B4286C2